MRAEIAQRLYAIKELPRRLAEREYRLLRRLAEETLPVVEGVGLVVGREAADGEPLEAALITKHLEFSMPYRSLFTGHGVPDLRNRLLDALAHLVVRLHLTGFFWGDCSLSNTLFRRDARAGRDLHEVLEHRWFLSEKAGRDVGMEEAAASYVADVLTFEPQERMVLPTDTGQIAPIEP